MIAVIDYGAGNIFSLQNALNYLKLENKLTSELSEIESADAIILPGVGAFPNAMQMLDKKGLTSVIQKQAKLKPFLGICLGMQLMFDQSEEVELTEGLSIIEGKIKLMKSTNLPIPHMGWNKLNVRKNSEILKDIGENEYVYFVHSFKAVCSEENIIAACDYEGIVPALVHDGAYAYGAQFHPEKSGDTGLKILKNFGGMI